MVLCHQHTSPPLFHPPKLLLLCAITTLFFFHKSSQLSLSYPHFSESDNTIVLQGDVYIQNDTVAQLTKYDKDSVGRLLYYKNMHLWDKKSGQLADFSTDFSFIINAPNKSSLGDGITFFLAIPDLPLPAPRDGAGIGLVSHHQMNKKNYSDKYPFVALEFDTSYNDWDPKYDHVGILVKSMHAIESKEWHDIKDGRIYNASINFNSTTNNLSVAFTSYQNNSVSQEHISAIVDLKNYLPEFVEFGFSSATGLFYELHTLLSWTFCSSDIHSSVRHDSNIIGELSKKLGIGVSIFINILVVSWLVFWIIKNSVTGNCHLFSFRNVNTEDDDDEDFKKVTGPKRFSYNELVSATDNFAEENKLGEGGFGGVYKGHLRDLDTYVAIKRVLKGSKQGIKEYASEVNIISQLRHKNLVKLYGWCRQKKEMLLVYEFLSNGSLDSHLFQAESKLTWAIRFKIAKGLASGLLYLHDDLENCVVHRDIKSSNVMLDSDFNPKLGDFGLARQINHSKGFKTTMLAGTIGYMAPEYISTRRASKKTDVYSFGVVILEIASGRKPIDPNTQAEDVSLVNWVWKLYGRGNLIEAADQTLGGQFDEQEMERLFMVGLWSVHPDSDLRPSARQASLVLNAEVPLPTLPADLPIPPYPANFANGRRIPSRSSSPRVSNASSEAALAAETSSHGNFTESSQWTISRDIPSASSRLLP